MKPTSAGSRENRPEGAMAVRSLAPADGLRGLELSTEAGWNQNVGDWQLLGKICHGLGMDFSGQGLVGTAMVWSLEDTFAWINMVLVTPAYRGQGIARTLMQKLLDELAAQDRIAFLDATESGEGLYRKLGFRDGPRLLRVLRRGPSVTTQPPAGMRPMLPADLDRVAALDREVFGMDRRELLAAFLPRSPQLSWVLEDAAGGLQGFVAARDGRVASQLGPLVAQNRDQASALLRQALTQAGGPLILDVPAHDKAWLDHVTALGFESQRGFMRMTHGEEVLPTDWSRYFAISGPDFA